MTAAIADATPAVSDAPVNGAEAPVNGVETVVSMEQYRRLEQELAELAERHRQTAENLRNAEMRCTDLQMEATRAGIALDDFKVQVGLRAMELARDHDWCEVVERALRDMDIPVPAQEVTFSVVVEFEINAEVASGRRDVSEYFLRESVTNAVIEFDSDLEEVDVYNYGIRGVTVADR